MAEAARRISLPELILACKYLAEAGESAGRTSATDEERQQHVAIVRKLLAE